MNVLADNNLTEGDQVANKGDQKTQIQCFNFNQTNSLFSVGTNTGFFVFSTNPFKERTRNIFRTNSEAGGIGIAELLFSSNIFALVGGGANPAFPPDRLVLWDDQQKKCLIETEVMSKKNIKAVRLQKNLMVVVLEDNVRVYDHEINERSRRETIKNPKGIIALSPDTDSIVMAIPHVEKGVVRVDLITAEKTTHIKAHETEIACLALNRDGSRLATCSEKGTLIRIFDTDTGEKLQEVRRGSKLATIYSISFSADSNYICCCSATGTVHLWAIDSKGKKNRTSSFSFISSIVPVGYVSSQWSMAEYRGLEGPALCSFGGDSSTVYVITAKGEFLTIKFDLQKGEAKLEATHQLDKFVSS
ncbi:WD repeat-containing protein [Acrasis kona]|uniref:WD repeat-containing protein n=1 Tax=Acrasis kona TaxID=1008807 RepID=A0AAW2YJB2_9EUKA